MSNPVETTNHNVYCNGLNCKLHPSIMAIPWKSPIEVLVKSPENPMGNPPGVRHKSPSRSDPLVTRCCCSVGKHRWLGKTWNTSARVMGKCELIICRCGFCGERSGNIKPKCGVHAEIEHGYGK